MLQRNAIVLIIDRLGAGYLGPYGNTWIDTPAFNRLASQASTFDQVIIDSPDVRKLYRTLWQGGHAAFDDQIYEGCPKLPQRISETGVSSTLITDERWLVDRALDDGFSESEFVSSSADIRTHESVEETRLAQLFAAAVERIDGLDDQSFLLWIHAGSLDTAWDAPLLFRNRFADTDDPVPPPIVRAPSQTVGPNVDPDELHGLQCAYAGQISLLDICLQTWLDAINPLEPKTLMLLMGSRGFPLGEHGIVGDADKQLLYSELVSIPLMVRRPSGEGAMTRMQHLVQPHDVFSTLADWFGIKNAMWPHRSGLWQSPAAESENLAATTDGQQWALRTLPWLARMDLDGKGHFDQSACGLFLKPDDRWDANNVADRCPEVVQRFGELGSRLGECRGPGDWQSLLPLQEELVRRID